MSATTDAMNAALVNIEAAVTALGAAYAAYESGRRQAKAARLTALGHLRAEDIDNAISTSQLDAVIAGRMNAVGLDHVLGHGLAGAGTQPADWVVAWASQVTSTVP